MGAPPSSTAEAWAPVAPALWRSGVRWSRLSGPLKKGCASTSHRMALPPTSGCAWPARCAAVPACDACLRCLPACGGLSGCLPPCLPVLPACLPPCMTSRAGAGMLLPAQQYLPLPLYHRTLPQVACLGDLQVIKREGFWGQYEPVLPDIAAATGSDGSAAAGSAGTWSAGRANGAERSTNGTKPFQWHSPHIIAQRNHFTPRVNHQLSRRL